MQRGRKVSLAIKLWFCTNLESDEEAEKAMRPSKRIRGIQEVPEAKGKSAVVPAAPKSKTSEKPRSSSGTLFFSHVEVPTLKDVQKQKSRKAEPIEVSSSDENDQSEGGDERPVRRLSRKVSQMGVYVDSDSEEKPTKATRDSKKKARSESPDFIVSDSDDADSGAEDDSAEVSDGEDSDAPKAKSRTKPKAKAKASAKPKRKTAKSESEDVMDVDEPVSTSEASSSKSKKRKRVEDKPKELPEAKDPWKLRGAAKRDWKQLHCPPLEMFHWARKIVDEYTYLDGKIHTLVTRLSADRHWVLSGTPPIHDFTAVKTIAAHLSLHLGIDDDNEGRSVEVKKRLREQTGTSISDLFFFFASDCVS